MIPGPQHEGRLKLVPMSQSPTGPGKETCSGTYRYDPGTWIEKEKRKINKKKNRRKQNEKQLVLC
jgi:hypothetical protein